MHSFYVDCDTFSYEEKVAAVFSVTRVEVDVTTSEVMLGLSFSTLSLRYLMKRLGMSALW